LPKTKNTDIRTTPENTAFRQSLTKCGGCFFLWQKGGEFVSSNASHFNEWQKFEPQMAVERKE
jgi:hypothetical protein